MRIPEKAGWYFASLEGTGQIECVKLRSKIPGDDDGCKMVVESAGYSCALAADKFVFWGAVELPELIKEAFAKHARDRAARTLESCVPDFVG